jgi:hypothetical protein
MTTRKDLLEQEIVRHQEKLDKILARPECYVRPKQDAAYHRRQIKGFQRQLKRGYMLDYVIGDPLPTQEAQANGDH